MANQLLIICGPTATGKTALAIKLAKKFNGEIISADARQLYKGLDIGTGKEVALLKSGNAVKSANKWHINGIPIHLYDVIDLKQQFSSAEYGKLARETIKEIWQRHKLPILVGGTGFYIEAAVTGLPSAGVAGNSALRRELEKLSTFDLQERLRLQAPKVFASLNNSDKNNPRRLIRKIELTSNKANGIPNVIGQKINADIQWIGLTTKKDHLAKRINSRVTAMFKLGLLHEIEQLLYKGSTFADPGLQTIGYAEFEDYYQRKQPLATIQNEIVLHTIQYTKRQQTWFKRINKIHWFDIDSKGYQERLELLVSSWYHT